MGTLAGLEGVAPSTQVLTDGYELAADNKGFYGNIRFWFAGADLSAFSSYSAGSATTLVVGSNSVTRLIPLKHPYIANCYCDSIKIYPPEGTVATVDGAGTGIAFADYFADLHFSTPSYDYEGGEYPTVTVQLDAGADMVTRPGSAYRMLSDGKRINHDVGVPVQTVDFTLTMNRLPGLDFALYASLAGCVNSTTFYGQDPGKILYLGPGVSGQYTIGGYPSFDVAHRFKFRSIEHNKIMRDDGAGFDYPVQSDGVTKMLPQDDLNQLWGM